MIGLDSNILLRYFTQDDVLQTQDVNALFESLENHEKGFISLIVLCEVCWTLKKVYKTSKFKILGILEFILEQDIFEIEDSDVAYSALRKFENGKADFSDYLILERAQKAGCDYLATFDKIALKEDGFQKP